MCLNIYTQFIMYYTKLRMKLSTVLKTHEETTSSISLKDNLGDGYLLQNNKVYKLVRDNLIHHNFKFTNHPPAEYLSFPMAQLENILLSKKIPYIDNVSPLQKVISKTNNLEWHHVVDNLKPNYLFHESCHAVARSLRPSMQLSSNENIITMFLEESFANTCELLAISYAQDSLHKNFLEMNSYCTLFESRSILNKNIHSNGFKNMFSIILISYLHSNFLREKINERELKSIIDFCEIKQISDLKNLRNVVHYVFELNPNFRYITADFYLRLNGFTQPVEQTLNFDFMQNLSESVSLREHFIKLSELFN